MPIYEYKCDGCGQEFQLLVLSSAGKVACPHCGGKKLERLFSTFAAHQGGSSMPCDSGQCPGAAAGMGGGGCGGGECPFS